MRPSYVWIAGTAVVGLLLALVACSDTTPNNDTGSLQRVADLGEIEAAAFVNNDYFIAVTDSSDDYTVFRSATGERVADLDVGCDDRTDCTLIYAFPNGADRLITTERLDDYATLRRLSDGHVIKIIHWQRTGRWVFANAPDGASFVVGPAPDLTSGESQRPLQPVSLYNSIDGAERANLGEIIWARFSSDGTRLFTRTLDAFQIRDARSGDVQTIVQDEGPVWFSRDESIAVFRSGRVIDPRTGEQVAQMPPWRTIGDISGDGSLVAVQEAVRRITGLPAMEGRWRDESFAFVWDIRTNSLVVELPDPQRRMWFALNNTRLISKYCGHRSEFCQLTLIDTQSGQPIQQMALDGDFAVDEERLWFIAPRTPYSAGMRSIVSRRLSDGELEYASDPSGWLNWEYFPAIGVLTYTTGPSFSGAIVTVGAGDISPTSECSIPLRAVRISDRTVLWEHPCARDTRRVGESFILVADGGDAAILLRAADGQRVGSMRGVEVDNAVISPDGARIIGTCTRSTQCESAGLWQVPSQVRPQ